MPTPIRATEPAPNRWRGLTALLTANGLAWTGTALASLAVPWFVLSTTGSALQTGLVVFAQMAPYVLAQALSGPLIDRVGPKRISVLGDVVIAVAMGTIPLLHASGALSLPLLMILLAVVGAAEGPANSAKSVFVPDVTSRAGVPLERTTGLLSTVQRTAWTLGPAIGGVLIGAWGGSGTLAVTAVLAAVSAGLTALALPDSRGEDAGTDARPAVGYFARLKQGFDFIRGDSLLLAIYCMVAITNLLDGAMFSILMPLWVMDRDLGPEFLGLLAAVLSGASIASSLVAAAWGHRLPRRLVYLGGFFLAGAPRFLVLALGAGVPAILGTYLIAGLGSGFLNPIIGALQFERIPRNMLGTVRGLGTAISWAGQPFGGLVGGALATGFGLVKALLIGGTAYFLTTTLPGLLPQWAGMRGGKDTPAERN